MTNPLPLSAKLESILLFKGGSVSVRELGAATDSSEEAVLEALGDLDALYEGRGMRLLRDGHRVALSTAPENKALIEAMRREELEGPLGRAGLETLAIILYRGPVSRADIEYIRGVNASAIPRTLMIRGLIERVENPKDKRAFMYRATLEVPAYFGIGQVSALPDFDAVCAELETVMQGKQEEPVAEPQEAV